MMRPHPWRRIGAATARQQRNWLFKLRSTTASHSASGASSPEGPVPPPALLTRMSARPQALTTPSTIAVTWAPSVTSTRRLSTGAPSARISASAASRDRASTSHRTIRAPSRAQAVAIALPIPRAEPVTIATRSLSFRLSPVRGTLGGGLLADAIRSRSPAGDLDPSRRPWAPRRLALAPAGNYSACTMALETSVRMMRTEVTRLTAHSWPSSTRLEGETIVALEGALP